MEAGPQYSPNGERIVFGSNRSGSYEIWECESDGANPIELTHFGSSMAGTPRSLRPPATASILPSTSGPT